MQSDMVTQISIALMAAAALALLAKLARQPLIIAYIAAGVALGSAQGTGWIRSDDIRPMADLGLILLLFMIGLEIKLKDIKEAGKTVLVAGVGQAVIGIGLGMAVFALAGFPLGQGRFDALYLSMAVSLSSTIIVVKLLYDRGAIDSAAGRITIGILIFEDIRAIFFIAIQPTLHNPAFIVIAGSILKTIAIIAGAFAVSRYLLPHLFRYVAKLPDLMMLCNLAWCFIVAGIAARLGLSWEMGAFIAGVSISSFPYNHDVIARITSLRDFFVTLFFISLGAQIPRPDGNTLMIAAFVSVFLIGSRFVSITPFLALMKAGKRSSFLPALNLSQISEFSLVICAIGLGLGHIDPQVLSIVVFVLVITSITSTYGIVYSEKILATVDPVLERLGIGEQAVGHVEQGRRVGRPLLFLGFEQSASSTLFELSKGDPSISGRTTVVELNPQVRKELEELHIHCHYGDVSQPDTLMAAGIEHTLVVVCTVSDQLLKNSSNARLLTQCRMLAPSAQIIVTANTLDQARRLYRMGAAYVFFPRLVSTRELAEVIRAALEGAILEHRQAALQQLEKRAEVLP